MQNTLEQMAWLLSDRREFLKKKKKSREKEGRKGGRKKPSGFGVSRMSPCCIANILLQLNTCCRRRVESQRAIANSES